MALVKKNAWFLNLLDQVVKQVDREAENHYSRLDPAFLMAVTSRMFNEGWT